MTILEQLSELYDTDEDRRAWLQSPQPLLSGDVPLSLMWTEEGKRRVAALLQGILDGAFL